MLFRSKGGNLIKNFYCRGVSSFLNEKIGLFLRNQRFRNITSYEVRTIGINKKRRFLPSLIIKLEFDLGSE